MTQLGCSCVCQWRTKSTIYGLRYAPECWFMKLKESLLKFGMSQLNSEPCWFRMANNELIVLVYVDGIIYASSNEALVKMFGEFLKTEYKLQVWQELKEYVGFQITRTDQDMKLTAEMHIQELAEKYGMHKSKGLNCPSLSGGVQLSDTDESLNEDQRNKFQQCQRFIIHWIIGSSRCLLFDWILGQICKQTNQGALAISTQGTSISSHHQEIRIVL
jgi:Reverse transcriptase (RNA-dependent DNA polymerase)